MVYILLYRLSDNLYVIRNNDFTIKEFTNKTEALNFKENHANKDDLTIVGVKI